MVKKRLLLSARAFPITTRKMTMRSNDTDTMIDFMLRQMSRFPLLSQDRTAELLQKVAQMNDLQERIDCGENLVIEESKIDRIIRNGQRAKTLLVNSNMRLVFSVAKKYQNLGLPLEDLIQEGAAGLIRGIERFNPRSGYKLSTFCWYWVRQAMTRSLALKTRTIRLPVKHYGMLHRIKAETRVLAQTLGRMPTRREVGEKLNLSDDDAHVLFLHAREPKSIDIPSLDDETGTIADNLQSRLERPDERLERVDRCAAVRDLLSSLSPTEAEVLRSRFGIGTKRLTVTDAGKKIGRTVSQTRYLESKAIEQLRERAKTDFSLAALA